MTAEMSAAAPMIRVSAVSLCAFPASVPESGAVFATSGAPNRHLHAHSSSILSRFS